MSSHHTKVTLKKVEEAVKDTVNTPVSKFDSELEVLKNHTFRTAI